MDSSNSECDICTQAFQPDGPRSHGFLIVGIHFVGSALRISSCGCQRVKRFRAQLVDSGFPVVNGKSGNLERFTRSSCRSCSTHSTSARGSSGSGLIKLVDHKDT